jgi:two-component system cell cycle sensor histidine kinase/response regulator CckA
MASPTHFPGVKSADRDNAPRILVVDDDPNVRAIAARILASEGFGVCEAEDGACAVELVRGGELAVCLVVSDIVMPRIYGVELVEALSVTHPSIPVILMSGYTPAALEARGIAAPCAVLRKPFSHEELLREVRRCLAAIS